MVKALARDSGLNDLGQVVHTCVCHQAV